MYTLISGSPKLKSSNSMTFLNQIKSSLEDYSIFELKKYNYDEIIKSINNSEVIVLAFPLYVDSPTSITLDFLDSIIDNKIALKNKLVYTIINCGFRDGIQNDTAANIIKSWCQKVNAEYSGSLLIGSGEIIGDKKYHYLSTTAIKKLNKFAITIKNKENTKNIVTTTNLLDDRLFCFFANIFWTKKAKRFKQTKKDIKKQ
jgi:multimeric flavodoxin WrbA